jgi:urease accessory protein
MTTNRALIHRPAGNWPKQEAVGAVTLDFDERHRRRFRLTTDEGDKVLLDLPKALPMAHGDGLQLEDGKWLRVQAAPEQIIEIRHQDLNQLMCLAWHLGNRHLPTEIRGHVLRIRPDHVIEEMLRGFGADLVKLEEPFQPQGGAYGAHGARHDHEDGGHDHA